MIFQDYEVPVAYSMVALANGSKNLSSPPFHLFACYWMAFNNIYVTIADSQGHRASPRNDPNGAPRIRRVGHVDLPIVDLVPEFRLIELAVAQFSDSLKDELIVHPSVKFFAHRTPRWKGQLLERDAKGQRLNGVLNVGKTVDRLIPFWSPLDTTSYEKYIAGDHDATVRNQLAKEIVDLLYTVRNNTFHGGKRADDANDREVVEKALPLLKLVVESFLAVRVAA